MSPERRASKAFVVRKIGDVLRAEPLDKPLPKPPEGHYLRVTEKGGAVSFWVETRQDKVAIDRLKKQLKETGKKSVNRAVFFDQIYSGDVNDFARKGFKKQEVNLR